MWVIPSKSVITIREGNTGIQVWSLQKAINAVQTDIAADGVFGPGTASAVKRFQEAHGLTADGIAGPATQKALAEKIVSLEELDDHTPVGLLSGFAEGEGGWLLAPVNRQVAGGVDCGLFQRRVYSADYDDDAAIQRAFDTAYQADLLAKSLMSLRGIFIARAGTNDGQLPPREKAWRLAALNHNYPTGADRLSRTSIADLHEYPFTYWTTPQSWVTAFGFKFPNGRPVQTPLEWCHLYAGVLGAGVYGTSGSVTRYVKNWS